MDDGGDPILDIPHLAELFVVEDIPLDTGCLVMAVLAIHEDPIECVVRVGDAVDRYVSVAAQVDTFGPVRELIGR